MSEVPAVLHFAATRSDRHIEICVTILKVVAHVILGFVPATRTRGSDPYRLLVVEDNGELAQLLAAALSADGYTVDVARDGQRGLHLGLTRPYDVVVIDRRLPALDGLDLLMRLRPGPSMPVRCC